MPLPAHLRMTEMIPMLSVTDLQRTIAFYREALAFEVISTFEYEGRTVWASLRHGDVNTPTGVHGCGAAFMFNVAPGSWVEERDGAARKFQIFYLYPTDQPTLESMHADLRSRGYRVSDLRVTVYGMKEFELRDPDQYWLWFGAPTDEAPTVTTEESPDTV